MVSFFLARYMPRGIFILILKVISSFSSFQEQGQIHKILCKRAAQQYYLKQKDEQEKISALKQRDSLSLIVSKRKNRRTHTQLCMVGVS